MDQLFLIFSNFYLLGEREMCKDYSMPQKCSTDEESL